MLIPMTKKILFLNVCLPHMEEWDPHVHVPHLELASPLARRCVGRGLGFSQHCPGCLRRGRCLAHGAGEQETHLAFMSASPGSAGSPSQVYTVYRVVSRCISHGLFHS